MGEAWFLYFQMVKKTKKVIFYDNVKTYVKFKYQTKFTGCDDAPCSSNAYSLFYNTMAKFSSGDRLYSLESLKYLQSGPLPKTMANPVQYIVLTTKQPPFLLQDGAKKTFVPEKIC